MENRIISLRRNTASLRRELVHLSPSARIRDRRMFTAQCEEKLAMAMERKLRECRLRADRRERLQNRMDRKLSEVSNSMKLYAAQLEQRSPLARLSGGYGYISDANERAVLSAASVEAGDLLNIQLRDGRIGTRVERVEPGE